MLTRSLFAADPKEYSNKLVDPAGTFVLIDKSYGDTSFRAVNEIRYHLSKRLKVKRIKVGHAGTLDPLATGLLILGIGKATKSLDSVLNRRKIYNVTLRLGLSSASHDLESQVIPVESTIPTREEIAKVLNSFMGDSAQIPPIHSAIKQQGKPIYLRARLGEDVQVVARNIEILSIELIRHEGPVIQFRIECSKGTYVRSLVRDIGKMLSTEAVMTDLRREAIGDWSVDEALPVESVKELLKA